MNITRILKNKLIIGVGCVVVAFLVAVILIPNNNKKSDEEVEVVKVNKVVAANTQITESVIKTEKMNKSSVPDNVITDKSKVLGKYSTVILYPVDFLMPEKLSDVTSDSNLYELDGGYQAVSVKMEDLSSSVSGKLIPGDVVSVYGYNKDTKSITSYPDLAYLEVLAVSNNKAQDIQQAQTTEDGSADARVPAVVTLKANQTQAQKLIQMQNEGTVHCTLAGRGDKASNLIQYGDGGIDG